MSFEGDGSRLERAHQGMAVLTGASPDGPRIELFSTDRARQMAVRGCLRRRLIEGLELGFAFERDRLPQIVDAVKGLESRRSCRPNYD